MSRYSTEVVASDEVFDAFCNDTNLGVECFRSTGWETEERATARIREHLYEHAEGVPCREAGAFVLNVTQEEYNTKVAEWEESNSVVVPDAGEVSE